MKSSRLIAGISLASLLAGCGVGPNFVPPDPSLPQNSFFAAATHKPVVSTRSNEAPVDPDWWAFFRDRELTSLEQRVAATNLDVRTATIRLAESRYQRGATASSLFPTLDDNGSYKRYQISNSVIEGVAGDQLPPSALAPFNLFQQGFDASWELDIWGHVRRQIEAADADIDVAADQRRGALVSALAEVARDYVQLRGIQEQIRIARTNVKTETDILDITKDREKTGVVTGLDVENAAAQVDSLRATIPDLERQESEAINALSLLLDAPPGGLAAELAARGVIPPPPPRIPVGIPSDLARRRPDIRQAEAQLHEATADIGVAEAAFYPTVTLNGTVGFQALDLKSLWKGSSLEYNFGPGVTMPLFEGGKLTSTLNLRTAQQQEAWINYHETVLKAWHDVVNALVAYRTEAARHRELLQQVDHASKALDLARSRYRDGVEQFVTVLDAERTLLSAQQQAAQSATNVSTYIVALYKALGGGWENNFPPEPHAPLTAALPGL
ncbi:RND transporter [Methylovirgula ligni]|uniref:NodT family efflux transporter outer membrane factor (OMF) lipoprotein n=1 Tax=Methylovirgula ligni TaxID=569860 RepID=A0A3D9YV25_9HYPH|nr:efflux transporter outer membrane subunit [Methylovirgula ligni]QAY95958.1 RND transporter [Methylovirgula ligni]REF86375.1 NodT family efflux transporter outer membrane factor (OMF) lipoprotein [Methylovirgula ligni]